MKLGYRLVNCPDCGEELDDFGKDQHTGEWEKQCFYCDTVFIKQGRRRWQKRSMSDPYAF